MPYKHLLLILAFIALEPLLDNIDRAVIGVWFILFWVASLLKELEGKKVNEK